MREWEGGGGADRGGGRKQRQKAEREGRREGGRERERKGGRERSKRDGNSTIIVHSHQGQTLPPAKPIMYISLSPPLSPSFRNKPQKANRYHFNFQ